MGKGKGGEDEDTSTWDLLVLYRKNCNKNGITTLKQLEQKFDQVFEEGDGILEEVTTCSLFFFNFSSSISGKKLAQWVSDLSAKLCVMSSLNIQINLF